MEIQEVLKGIISRRTSDSEASLPLVIITMELTERCNNNCIHCYINRPAEDLVARNKELATHEIKRILSEIAALGCMGVKFTGGEPLLRDDFEEIYVFARKLGLRVFLLTNATLLNKKLAKLFSRIPPLEQIEVTLYGTSKGSYEKITRIQGSYAAALEGIRLLRRYKIPFMLKGVVFSYNKSERDSFKNLARTILGKDTLIPYTLFLDLNSRRDARRNIQLQRLRLSPEDCAEFLMRDRRDYFRSMREFCAKFTHPCGENLFPCSAGLKEGCVDAYGKLQPCMLVRHPDAVYNLKQGSLEDAFRGFFPRLRAAKATNPEYLNRCARCFLKGLCRQCPGRSWMEHGTMDTPVEYHCDIAHAQAKALGLLKEGTHAWEVRDWKARLSLFTGTKIS